jgi:hypothetical protein
VAEHYGGLAEMQPSDGWRSGRVAWGSVTNVLGPRWVAALIRPMNLTYVLVVAMTGKPDTI